MKKDLGRVNGGLARDFRNTVNSALGDIENNFKEAEQRIDNVVVNASSGEIQANDARLNAKGEVKPSLKKRLDDDYTEVTAQLADKANKNEVTQLSATVNSFQTGQLEGLSDSDTLALLAIASDITGKTFPTPAKRIDSVESAVREGFVQLPLNDLEVGGISHTDGTNVSNTTAARTSGYYQFEVGSEIQFSLDTNYQIMIAEYSQSNTFVKYRSWSGGNFSFKVENPKLRFTIRYMNGASAINLNLVNSACIIKVPTLIKGLQEGLKNKIDKSELFDTDIPLGGYISNAYMYNGQPQINSYSNGLAATYHVSVLPGYRVTIEKVALAGNTSICYYDSQQNYLGDIPKGSINTNGATISFDVPSDCSSIRFSFLLSDAPTVKIYYSGSNLPSKLDNLSDSTIEDMKKQSELMFTNFLKTAGKTPLVTWIDDDTPIASIPNVKSICDTLGIKATFACITNRLDSVQGLKDLLLSYQEQGHHITTHSDSHDYIWYSTRPEFNVSSCETDLVKSLQKLRQHGFLESDYIVTPAGSHTAPLQKMCKKWCRGLVRADGGANHLYNGGRFGIKRIFINKTTNNLDYYKSIIDEAYTNGDWVIFGTHSGISAEWDSTLVQGVFSYALSKGIEVAPLNQAMNQRKYVYDVYEMFG